jgi:hypothetical protein
VKGFQMTTRDPDVRAHTGQTVRIIACPQQHPDHVGQVGEVVTTTRHARTRVYVGNGICQASLIEVMETPPVVRADVTPYQGIVLRTR